MAYPGYLSARSGMRLEPQDTAGEGLLGARIYGSGGAQVYGGGRRGRGRAKTLEAGLMPGHILVPERHMHHAVRAFKHLHGIHGEGLHLPHGVPLHIIETALKHDDEQRGGFLGGLLPLVAGAAGPLIGEALKGLVGGFANKGGQQLAGRIAGNGLAMGIPMPVHHNGERHFHIHGDGFKDLMKRTLGFAKKIITSNPARKIGHFALQTLKEAIMNALVDKLNSFSENMSNRLNKKETEGSTEGRPVAADMTSEVPAGEGMHALRHTKRPATTGDGKRRKRRKTTTAGGALASMYGGNVY